MVGRPNWRIAAWPVRTAAPALAAFLVTGAGVAAIAQPTDAHPEPARLTTVPAATIRIVLPPPAPPAPGARDKSAETPGFSPHRLAAVTPVVGAAAVLPAKPATAPAVRPAGLTPQRMDAPQRTGASARPVATSGAGEAEYAAALRIITAKPPPPSIPMADAESRAAAARVYDTDEVAPPSRDRMAALQPVPARALIDSTAPHDMRPSSAAMLRMQPDETIGRYRQTAQGLAFEVAATVNGTSAGPVSLLIRDGENISIRLADLLAAVEPTIAAALYEKLSGSQAAQSYMTFNQLREAGIAVRFNDDDRLILGIR
ncbi:MAG: hypothetical protein JF595_08925 [Sphingomonadales bacterium]|nr:hypothetical protein [Sphingomonadales bacterium]